MQALQGFLVPGTYISRKFSENKACMNSFESTFLPSATFKKNGPSSRQSFAFSVKAEVRTEQKVKVTLGEYKNGVLKATAPSPKVTQEEVEKAFKNKQSKTYELERINFTGSGAKLGHTVTLKFEGKLAEGPKKGQTIPGTKAENYVLDLKERDDEPWATFVKEIVAKGMGQEESKSFELTFPPDYKAKALAGIKALFTVTVKEIAMKKELEIDTRPEDVQKAEIEAELQSAAERATNEILDKQLKEAVLETSEADVEKVAASVTWAKFGEKSLKEFKWNVLQEEIARVEEIPFDQVPAFLRSQATITYT